MAKSVREKAGKITNQDQTQNGSKCKQYDMGSEATDDHHSLKPRSQRLCSTVFTVLCGTLTLMIFAYLYKTCFDILSVSWTNQEDSACYLGLFSCTTESTRQLTITDGKFYVLLYNAILEDLSLTLQFVYISIKNLLSSIEMDVSMLISYSSLIFTSLCIILWFLYYWKLEQKRKKNLAGNGHAGDTIVRTKAQRSIWRWLPRLTFLAFLISIPWEFVRLYQLGIAEKVTHITKGIPDECVWANMTYIQYFKSLMTYHFSWSSDACYQYHTALHVDPVWQVTPLLVLTSVISNCIVHPLENLCAGLGRAFRLFFSEIPSQWQPVMLAVIVIILLMVMVMLFGYKVHFPFIKIEPKTPTNVKVKCRVRRQQLETKALEGCLELDSSQETDS